jgi:ribonuclease G
VFTPDHVIRRVERSVRKLATEGKKDNLIVRVHPEVALYVLEQEKDFVNKLQKGLGFSLELRDDPLLKPDDFRVVIRSAGREVAHQYAAAS